MMDTARSAYLMNADTGSRPTANAPVFSRQGYRELLGGFLSAGYAIVDFDTVDKNRRHLIVRHDVDLCVDAAVRMAEIESQMGVKSTYFVMVGGTCYNIFTRDTKEKLIRLVKLGHGLGLHFDIDAYASPDDEDALEKCKEPIAYECRLLETVTQSTVRIVSFHKPIRAVIGHEHPMGGKPHTYEPRFIKDIAYVSDSRGAWRFGHPFEHEAFAAGAAMQLLTHPIWWDRDEPLTPEAALEQFVIRHMQNFEVSLAVNCQPYQRVLDRRTHNRKP